MKKALLLLIILHSITCYPMMRRTIPIVTGLPKAGSHLLLKCIGSLNRRRECVLPVGSDSRPSFNRGDYSEGLNYFNHFEPHKDTVEFFDNPRFRGFYMERDPRAILAATIRYLSINPEEWYDGVRFEELFKLQGRPIDEVLQELLDNPPVPFNEPEGKRHDFATCIEYFTQWRKAPHILTTRFEYLVGEKGGGSKEKQAVEIRRIAEHLGLGELTDDEVQECARSLFRNSPTFVRGQIRNWRTFFDYEQQIEIKQRLGALLIELGYERTQDW